MSAPTPEKVEIVMKGLLRLKWLRGFDQIDQFDLRSIAETIAEFVSIKPKKHADLAPDGSDIVPFDWLIAEVRKTCEWFPAPIQMRRVYEQYWPCLDHRSAASFTNVLEGV